MKGVWDQQALLFSVRSLGTLDPRFSAVLAFIC